MPAHLSKIISIGSKATGPEIKKSLSIELRPDGFSFCILDNQKFKYLALESYRANLPLSPEQWAGAIEWQVMQNPLLSEKYQNVSISWFSRALILVPKKLFSFDNKDVYFEYTNTLPVNHEITNDWLHNLQAYGIYSLPVVLKEKLEELFPGHRIRHSGTILIESLLAALQLNEWKASIALNISSKHFDIVLFDQQKLLYYNSFRYEEFGDLMYFLFFVLEQFNLEANNLDALLLGEISMDSDRFLNLSKYFRNVRFIQRSDIYRYHPEFDALPHHYFYTLLNLNSCG